VSLRRYIDAVWNPAASGGGTLHTHADTDG
jgi:hypothetical protein